MHETRKASLKNDSNSMEIKALCAGGAGESHADIKKPPEKGGKPGVTKVYKYLVRKRGT
jgi:hypothetical protein